MTEVSLVIAVLVNRRTKGLRRIVMHKSGCM
jgi:hypothetical protein